VADHKDDPIVFANKVLAQYAKALLGYEKLEAEDCNTMRVTFRNLGGSWSDLSYGDPKAVGLASQIVVAWGKLKGKAGGN